MKDANGSEDWRVLCELASKEKDPKKMIDLITKINQALEELHRESPPLNANAHFDSIAAVITQPVC
jgi:hypothetical protein